MITRGLSLTLLIALPCLLGSAGAAKPRGKRPPAAQAALTNAINSHRDEIQGCLLSHAGAAQQIEVQARITINGRGQLIHDEVRITAAGAAVEPMRACIDQVLRAIKWPQNPAVPLIHIERSWSAKFQ